MFAPVRFANIAPVPSALPWRLFTEQEVVAGGLSDESCGPSSNVLVTLERRAPKPPSVHALRVRFRLTLREAGVTLLLAQRKTNAEIAATLSISTHTARHHTERVLAKLGIRSRQQVQKVLLSQHK